MLDSRFTRKKSAVLVLIILVFVILVNPYGVATGNLDIDPYRSIRAEVAGSSNGKILMLSSFDDFYSFRSTNDLRRETSEAYVERGYDEILSAASLGDRYFNQFLQSKGITHILVPLTTSQRGQIRFKWGEHGSIRIRLWKPFFTYSVSTAGDYPVVLYKVNTEYFSETPQIANPNYLIKWGKGIRGDFYQVIRSKVKNGLYSFNYTKRYEGGIDLNWVFAYPRIAEGVSDLQEIAEFQYQSKSAEMNNVSIEIILVAAYGGNAPPQIVRVIQNGKSRAYLITPSNPAKVKLSLSNGDKVRFDNVLPCRQPQTFEAGEYDWRKYCFGIRDIQVRPES
jgi:hypothetical protein